MAAAERRDGSGPPAPERGPQSRRRTIRGRIRLALGVLLGLLVVAAGLGWWSTHRLEKALGTTLDGVRIESGLTAQLSTTIAQELHAAASHLLRNDPLSQNDFYRLRAQTRRIYLSLNRNVNQTAEEARLVARIENELALVEVHYATAHRLADLERDGEARREASLTVPIARGMLLDVARLEALQQGKLATLFRRLQAQGRAQGWLLAALLAAGLAAAVLTARQVERTVSRPLEELAAHAGRLSRGDLATRTAAPAALPDEVRVLASAMNDAGDSLARLAGAEAALRQSEKMAALGRLSAGMAHEINSPLGGILNSVQLAREYAEELLATVEDPAVTPEARRELAAELMEVLQTAETATAKVGRFVRTMKEQTRPLAETGGLQAFDASAEVEATVALVLHELRDRGVRLHTDVAAGLRLRGQPESFSSVLRNLLSNAVDAYDDRPGEVWIRLFPRDGRAVLEVEDHGAGIAEELRGRVFDYMFTTKDVGRGTGLGLPIVLNLVTSHFQGTVDFRSQVGRGTTFVVTLPLAAP
jgi:signal transduction histidine kinase